MNGNLVTLAVVVGAGTYLFRFLPTRFRALVAQGDGFLPRFFAAIGAAAIATLFVASVLPIAQKVDAQLLCALAGSGAVLLLFLWRRNVVLATLGGALAYGLVYQVAVVGF